MSGSGGVLVAGDRSGSRFGPYELRRLIGRGGMGEVYEAYDTTKDRVVALKLLPSALADDGDYRERFRREARTAARLQNPHVIPIHDFGEIDGVLFIDMRLVTGHDLKSMIRQGPVAPAVAVALITQVASALDAAHQDGLVHRDVKPENVLVTQDQFAYLADFGIASSGEDTRLTGTGSAIGSIAYMGPERFRDDQVTGSVDIYALTCLLYELLTGSVPYPRNQVSAQISAHLYDPPPAVSGRVSGLGPAMDAVIARGLAKDPRQRFATASDLARAAHDALAGGARADTATLLHRSGATDTTSAAPIPAAASGPTGVGAAAGGYGQYGGTGGSGGTAGSGGTGPTAGASSDKGTRAAWIVALIAAALALLAVGGVVVPKLLDDSDSSTAGQQTQQPDGTDQGAQSSPQTPGSSEPTGSSSSGTSSSESSSASSSTSEPTSSSATSSATSEPTSSSSSPTSSTTEPSTSSTEPGLSGSGFDRQGWTHDAKARCNSNDSAVAVGRTSATYLVVCRVGNAGGTYYRGYRTTNGLGTEIQNPTPSGSGWVANKDGYTYDISSSALVIRQGDKQVLDEPMEQYAP